MDHEQHDPEFEGIIRLIQEEEKEALEIFRQRNFRRKVKSRIGELPDRGRSRFFSWKPVIPAVAAALLLIASWAVLSHRRLPFAAIDGEAGSFIAGLEGLPRLTELASRQAAPLAGDREIPGGPRSIRDVLALAQQKKPNDGESAPLPPGILKVPRLSLERKMTILFKDKAIERVLVLIRKKSEEV